MKKKNMSTILYCFKPRPEKTRGSVGWACVTHLSLCFEETQYRTFHIGASHQISVHFGKAVSE